MKELSAPSPPLASAESEELLESNFQRYKDTNTNSNRIILLL